MSSPTVTPLAGAAGISPLATPHRPVVFLALVLFVPELWLVLNGNLSVQTALVRFIAALLVSWVAARLVLATLRSGSRSPAPAELTGQTDSASFSGPAGLAGPAGRADATPGSTGIVGDHDAAPPGTHP